LIAMPIRAIWPRQFEFRYGDCFDCYSGRLILRDGCLIYGTDEIDFPSEAAWLRFRKAVEAAGVFEWKQRYEDPYTLDGISWNLDLAWEDRSIFCSGSNSYPPGFEELLSAVEDLSGITF